MSNVDSKVILENNFIENDTIENFSTERGYIIFNDDYYITSSSHLINNYNTFPSWLKKEDNSMIFIRDIDVPFILFKKADEQFFYVIKNNDTLKFKLEIY